jgi:D-3-phosphoglycerate dehydrogenase
MPTTRKRATKPVKARPQALITAPFSDEGIERLSQHFDVRYECWIETRKLHNPAELVERARRRKIALLVVEADFMTRDLFSLSTLRLTGVCRNQLNLVDLNAATEFGVPVLNTPTRNSIAVAELTIGLMIAVSRQVPASHTYVTAKKWTDPIDPYVTFRGREIHGSVVGIVGFGSIGQMVAERARCLGAKVIAHDPFASKETARSFGVRLVSLEQLLRDADFVSLHTAQSPETESMIDGAAIDTMKPTAYLVSIGAGNAVDEDALAARLRKRRIAGAALDVFHGHFISTSSPLLELDNVVLTPHTGGATAETVERQSKMIVDDVERFLSGRRPRHVANPASLKHPRHGG